MLPLNGPGAVTLPQPARPAVLTTTQGPLPGPPGQPGGLGAVGDARRRRSRFGARAAAIRGIGDTGCCSQFPAWGDAFPNGGPSNSPISGLLNWIEANPVAGGRHRRGWIADARELGEGYAAVRSELKRLSLADFAHETQARLAAVEAVIGPLKYAEWSGVRVVRMPGCKAEEVLYYLSTEPRTRNRFRRLSSVWRSYEELAAKPLKTIWGQVFDDSGKARPVVPHGEKFGPKRIDREALARA